MLHIKVDDQATARLAELARRGENLAPPMRAIAAGWREQVAMGFSASVDPYGGRWAALRSRSGQPLLNTGRLRNSFQAVHGRDFASVGTNVPYAEVHQRGMRPTKIRPKNARVLAWKTSGGNWRFAKHVNHPGFPARPMLPDDRGLPDSWREVIDEALDAWFGAS